MAHKTKIGSTTYEIKGGKCNVGGTAYSIKNGKTKVGGTAYTIDFVSGALGEIPVGTIVYLNENGSSVPFYVAKHNYESGLNGSGRTLLVRKAISQLGAWNSAAYNTYASGTMDTWFNSTYKPKLDSAVQTAMSTTTFYYTVGNKNATKTTLSRSVFALSMTELGGTFTNSTNVEGSTLSIASTLRFATNDSGTASRQWTRTPMTSEGVNTVHVVSIYDTGETKSDMAKNTNSGYRPCFTLPATAIFDPATKKFVSA